MSRQSCLVCAWRENCNKRFSVCDGGARCPDFSRDVSIKDTDNPLDDSPARQGHEVPE